MAFWQAKGYPGRGEGAYCEPVTDVLVELDRNELRGEIGVLE